MNKIDNLKLYKDCLIIVDMVNGFVREGVLHDEEISKIIPTQIKLIKEAKETKQLIIFIKDNHTKESTEFERFGNTTHCLKGTSESEVVDELKIYEQAKDTISITKNSTSFMEAPDFRKLLERQTTLENFNVVGCCTDICITNGVLGLANYLDENNRKHSINVYLDAIATYDEENRRDYVNASKILLKQQGVNLINTKRKEK
ncbi:MAG: cysteine hydrolase [bacterium]|nr:cysteine hydrolase [bacterium]